MQLCDSFWNSSPAPRQCPAPLTHASAVVPIRPPLPAACLRPHRRRALCGVWRLLLRRPGLSHRGLQVPGAHHLQRCASSKHVTVPAHCCSQTRVHNARADSLCPLRRHATGSLCRRLCPPFPPTNPASAPALVLCPWAGVKRGTKSINLKQIADQGCEIARQQGFTVRPAPPRCRAAASAAAAPQPLSPSSPSQP